MRTKIYNFWDFDGTLMHTPLPDPGKTVWKDVKGTDYPHLGWWSKPESLNLEVFDIRANEDVKAALLAGFENGSANYILTSRVRHLSNHIKDVLAHNDIDVTKFTGFSFASARNKGQRILDYIAGFEDLISEINVYEDRDKEFVVLEEVRPTIEGYGIKYTVHRIENQDDRFAEEGKSNAGGKS